MNETSHNYFFLRGIIRRDKTQKIAKKIIRLKRLSSRLPRLSYGHSVGLTGLTFGLHYESVIYQDCIVDDRLLLPAGGVQLVNFFVQNARVATVITLIITMILLLKLRWRLNIFEK